MKTERGLLICIAAIMVCITAVGCAGNNRVTAHIDRLTEKIHVQEEDIIRLQNELMDCRQENEALREAQGGKAKTTAEAVPPEITSPRITSPSSDAGISPTQSTPSQPVSRQRSDVVTDPGEINPYISQLYLHPPATGGYDSDGKPGDDGITILIEPRNKNGQYVPIPAPIAVALLDPVYRNAPVKEQQKGIIGRWRYSAKEVERMITASPSGRGIYVRIPWAKRPEHSRLTLHVRYTSLNGKPVTTKKELFVRLPGTIAGWSPRVVAPQSPVNVARQRHPDQIILDPQRQKQDRPSWRPNRD